MASQYVQYPASSAFLVGQSAVMAAVTNLMPQSQALATTWTANGTVVAAPTATNNTSDTLAPDGTQTATKVVYPAVGAAQASYLQQLPGVSTNTYTLSMWIKGTGAQTFAYGADDGGSNIFVKTCAVTANWQRFSLTFATTANLFFRIGTNTGVAGYPTISAQTVYIWGVQLEQSASMSGIYVATTTGSASATGVLVPASQIASTSLPVLSHAGVTSANLGTLIPTHVIPGTSFEVHSSNSSDTDKVNWLLSL